MWSKAFIQVAPEHKIFLEPRQRQQDWLTYQFQGNPSVKDAFEALGIPHTDVEALTINQKFHSFSTQIQDGDCIELFFSPLESAVPLRLKPPRPLCFVLDEHLNRLMIWLRLLGFDTILNKAWDDPSLAGISSREKRVLLTRDVGLLKRSVVLHGYFVRNTQPRLQLTEVVAHFSLTAEMRPFRLCTVCNSTLKEVEKSSIVDRVEAKTYQHYAQFYTCTVCQRVYWKGSHYENILQNLGALGMQPQV